MSCALTVSYTQDCRDSIGGVKEIRLVETANVESFTLTAGVITAVTMTTGNAFLTYKPAKETAYAKSKITTNVQNGSVYFAQEAGIVLHKMQTPLRLEVQNLAKNNIYIATKDQNGKNWLYGYKNGMDLSDGESGTGTAPADRNGYGLTFTGQEPEDAIEINSATWDDLIVPGS